MLRSKLLVILWVFPFRLFAQHPIHIEITSLPPEPRTYDLYMAGSFNNWNPADEKFMFQRKGNGQFYIDVNLPAGNYEYKITRGSWKEVETNTDGSDKSNRVLKVEKEESISVSIAGWKDQFAAVPVISTASKQVRVADTAMYMPQLKRKRKIEVYLPEGYGTSKERYPVLYMHDGQNLFDDKTSGAGEWGVDEFMDTMRMRKCIVVAIANDGIHRLHEYSPWDFRLKSDTENIIRGEGKAYTDFLVKTLKPYIDKKYRTRKDKANTWVAGSSMGGLISFYAVLQYPTVFGGAGIFSPSVWIAKQPLLSLIKIKGKKVNSRLFFFCSKEESPDMAPDMLLAFQQLARVSKSPMTTIIRDQGGHNEGTWRKELPLFYEFIVK
ncbi:MAG: alpha/beta hydrolase-fold protein [Bacteroidetes bacterium]|nr:alpha/beta hydrolase-fold protein [Bacteroidota bacterium]